MVDAAQVQGWIAGYERAWRTSGTDGLAALFTEDVRYRTAPFREPLVGLDEVARLWEAEREGPEPFALDAEVVAVTDQRAVARLEVHDGGLPPDGITYRDLWVLDFAADGRCRSSEEWPHWPEGAPGRVAG